MTKPRHEPLLDRVLIEPYEFEWGPESSIIKPDTVEEPAETGIVRAVGAECKVLQVGDHVTFGRFSGVPIGNTEYLMMREEDVYSRVHDIRVKAKHIEVVNPAREIVGA